MGRSKKKTRNNKRRTPKLLKLLLTSEKVKDHY